MERDDLAEHEVSVDPGAVAVLEFQDLDDLAFEDGVRSRRRAAPRRGGTAPSSGRRARTRCRRAAAAPRSRSSVATGRTVARLATNSPLSCAKVAESFYPSLEKPTIGGALQKGVEETIGREIDPPVAGARRDPADRPRRDDRLERIVRQQRPCRARASRRTWRSPQAGKGVTISASAGRGRSSVAGSALPIWMKPAICSCVARPIAARNRAS